MVDFLKLLKRELSHNLGIGILTFLYIAFSRLVPFVSILLYRTKETKIMIGEFVRNIDTVYYFMGEANFYHFAVVLTLSSLFGLIVCRYLHKKTTADFYLSQPFKRITIFAAKYFSFIIIFALCYGLNLILMLFAYIGLDNGKYITDVMIYGLTGFLNGVFGFWLIYSSVVLAGLLTGCILAHIALGALFMYIVPLTIFLIVISREIFCNNYISIPEEVYKISPLLYFAVSDIDENVLREILTMAAASAGLTAVDFVLCKRRKAETAGRVLTFNGEPLRFFLSLVYGLLGGVSAVFLFNGFVIRGETVTFTAGFFIVTVISSIIMEIIFNANFGAAFKNKRWLGISVVTGAVLIALLYLGGL